MPPLGHGPAGGVQDHTADPRVGAGGHSRGGGQRERAPHRGLLGTGAGHHGPSVGSHGRVPGRAVGRRHHLTVDPTASTLVRLPIRTLTVGPGVPPGQPVTGCHRGNRGLLPPVRVFTDPRARELSLVRRPVWHSGPRPADVRPPTRGGRPPGAGGGPADRDQGVLLSAHGVDSGNARPLARPLLKPLEVWPDAALARAPSLPGRRRSPASRRGRPGRGRPGRGGPGPRGPPTLTCFAEVPGVTAHGIPATFHYEDGRGDHREARARQPGATQPRDIAYPHPATGGLVGTSGRAARVTSTGSRCRVPSCGRSLRSTSATPRAGSCRASTTPGSSASTGPAPARSRSGWTATGCTC